MEAPRRFGQDDIDRIGARLASTIDDAAVGICEWQAVVDVVAEEFPGSAVSLHNQDVVENRMNFAVTRNFDPEFITSYMTHYAYVNPWLDAWANAEDGAVLISEEHMPAHLIRHSEFYNDWLRPQGDLDGSVGINIRASAHDTIHMPIHYAQGYCAQYDRPLARMLELARPAFRRSVELARAHRSIVADASARAGLSARSTDVAFVIDRTMRVRSANEPASDLFRENRPFRHLAGRIGLHDAACDGAFQAAVSRQFSCATAPAARLITFDRNRSWSIASYRVPGTFGPSESLLLAPVPLVLVVARDLSAPCGDFDPAPFARAFGLTRAETRLCAALAQGLTLADAAARNNTAYATARKQLQAVFLKTGTCRQAELCVLLARFAHD